MFACLGDILARNSPNDIGKAPSRRFRFRWLARTYLRSTRLARGRFANSLGRPSRASHSLAFSAMRCSATQCAAKAEQARLVDAGAASFLCKLICVTAQEHELLKAMRALAGIDVVSECVNYVRRLPSRSAPSARPARALINQRRPDNYRLTLLAAATGAAAAAAASWPREQRSSSAAARAVLFFARRCD